QVFLLVEINSVLCNPAVRGIREVYSTYQKAIYGDNVYQTVNGFWRGNEGADMNEQGFLDLSKDMQFKVCNVSLSQPYYTLVILLVWTFTCLAEIRVSLMMARNLLWHTPVVEHVTECMERTEDNCKIVGLTMPMKFCLLFFCFLPRCLLVVILNYLGCRWLLASESLGDLFLNSLALEFMVLLPELLYRTFAAERSILRTEATLVHSGQMDKVSLIDVLAAFAWIIIAVLWVCTYLFHLQAVLPGYEWDVHHMCAKYRDILQG
ncbi:unnamed protein product, partial [Durusdinium trenchii]